MVESIKAETVNARIVVCVTDRGVSFIAFCTASQQVLPMTEINTERIAREVGVEESVVSDVVSRLLLVRGNLTDSGFHALVRDVVRTKVSFKERDAREDLSVVRIRPRAD